MIPDGKAKSTMVPNGISLKNNIRIIIHNIIITTPTTRRSRSSLPIPFRWKVITFQSILFCLTLINSTRYGFKLYGSNKTLKDLYSP